MCMICGQPASARAAIAVTPDRFLVHRGACHRQWMTASGFERVRWIARRRATAPGPRQPALPGWV